ncbi:MAG: hypothetical protein HY966_04700 [Ignavibacteriales bacterium]|nr:hypothetical protein [Ignavibacteriales bacterium]
MDVQQLISLTIVAATFVLLIRGAIVKRQRSRLRACGSDCGCESPSALLKAIPPKRLAALRKQQKHRL